MPKNKTLKDILGENVLAVMKAKGLSQPKVASNAKLAGTAIDQTTVGRVARAVYPATVDTLEALANGLGVDAHLLLRADFSVESLPLSDRELAQLNQAKNLLAGLSDAQRDVVRDLLTQKPYPSENMGPGWTRPDRRKPLIHLREQDVPRAKKKRSSG